MNYVAWNFGDFNNATRHLTRVERSVYRDSIDHYYDTEQPLNGVEFSRLAKRLLCSTDEEKQALRDVLAEFFVEKDGFYSHARCEAEIAKYRANNSAKARAGIASAAARKHKPTGVEQVLNTCATNQEPITNNQEPIKPIGLKNTALTRPADVTEETWADFGKLRKAKGAPLTATALKGIRSEVEKAGITLEAALAMACNRGWTSFMASWLLEKPNQNAPPTSQTRADKRENFMSELTGNKGNNHANNQPSAHGFIEVETRVVERVEEPA